MRSINGVNVCVTGGAGFLGSHLVDHLIEDRNCEVLVIDDLSAGNRAWVHPKAHFVHCDITGTETYLYKLFKNYKIKYVFNYAAVPYIPYSFERPLRVFDINAHGALKVINAAQEAGCDGILQVSSAEIYGDAGQTRMVQMQGDITDPDSCKPAGKVSYLPNKINELAKVQPHSTYGVAKAAIDAMVQVRWKEAKTPCIALRQFNGFGPRETHPYIIPEIIQQVYQQDKADTCVVRLGNDSYRDFQYCDDAVRMAVELLEYGTFGEVYNLGSQQGIKMYALAALIGHLMGRKDVQVVQDPSRVRPWEIWHLQADCTKIHSAIKYRHLTSFEDGLLRTIEDFRSSGHKWHWQ